MTSSGNQFRLWCARAAQSGGGGSFTITGSGYGDAAYAAFAPRALSHKVMRSFQPSASESSIWPQEECALPRSSAATSWIVGGTDVADFEAGTTGSIQFTAACIAGAVRKNRVLTLTPVRSGAGSGSAITLTVGMTANASDEFFVSAGAANQSGNGSFATPWKYMPGSADYSSAFAVSTWASGGGADKCVFLKAEIHRTTHCASKTDRVNMSTAICGTSGHPFWVEMNGWGDRAILDGSDVVSGWAAVTQGEVGGNASYASIKKVTTSYVETFMRLFDGASICYPAQWPTPVDLGVNELIDYHSTITNELYGIRNYPCQVAGGTRRMFTNGVGGPNTAGTTITIVDPDFATMFGNVTLASLGPIQGIVRNGSNFFFTTDLFSYVFATSTIVINSTSAINAVDGYASFALINHPLFIVKAGQYCTSADGLTVYAWLPNNSTTSISRRYVAFPWGHSGYCTYNGGTYQRYANGSLSDATPKQAGVAYWYRGSGTVNEIDLTNGWYLQDNCNSGEGVIYSTCGAGAGGGGIAASNIELNYFSECCRSSGIRLTAAFDGTTGVSGDWAQIKAGLKGKIRANAGADNAMGQTFILLSKSDGVHITLNHMKQYVNLHGNFISPYDASSSAYNVNLVMDFNFIDDGARSFTNEIHKTGGGNMLMSDNIFLNTRDEGAAVQLNDGLPGGRVTRNLVMGGEASYNYNYSVLFGGGGSGFEMDHNVFAGFDTSAGANWTGNIHDNLITVDQSPPSSVLGGTYTNNTKYTGSPNPQVYIWNGTFTSDMISTLGTGPIGVFHTV